jgi:DNA-binding response OmpR family regulator
MPCVKALLISSSADTRQQMGLAVRSVRRKVGDQLELLHAADGIAGMQAAHRLQPAVVVVDEILSGAGAFAVAKDLKGSIPPYPGRVIILLERAQDAWLARWSGADAWFVQPVDPFELAETVAGYLTAPEPIAKEAV